MHLQMGADVTMVDYDTRSMMHYASSCGHLDCVQLLTKKQAPVDMADKVRCLFISSSFWLQEI